MFSLSFSPSGDRFLVVTGAATPKVYDRDGTGRGTFPRGDMYIRDMKNTKGAHPSQQGLPVLMLEVSRTCLRLLSGAMASRRQRHCLDLLRGWDTANLGYVSTDPEDSHQTQSQKSRWDHTMPLLIDSLTRTYLTGRVAVTCCAYNADGSLIVGGLRDGSIQLWGAKGERVGRSAAVELVCPNRCHITPSLTHPSIFRFSRQSCR